MVEWTASSITVDFSLVAASSYRCGDAAAHLACRTASPFGTGVVAKFGAVHASVGFTVGSLWTASAAAADQFLGAAAIIVARLTYVAAHAVTGRLGEATTQAE